MFACIVESGYWVTVGFRMPGDTETTIFQSVRHRAPAGAKTVWHYICDPGARNLEGVKPRHLGKVFEIF